MASNVLIAADNSDRNQYEKEDGHTLLLMETVDGNKTYSDYSNVTSAIENLISIFEDFRKNEGHMDQDYDLTMFWDWIDNSFKSLDIMIFDKNTLRYKRRGCEEFKEIMYTKMRQSC